METLDRATEAMGIIRETTVSTVYLDYAGIVAFQGIFDETVYCLRRPLTPLELRVFRNRQILQHLLEDPG